MRTPTYLSPTSVSKWYDDRDGFYLKYLADNKIPKEPQTQPMSIGSAFDAYVKSYLTQKLFGTDKGFELEQILCDQVEPHNRDWARVQGEYVFNCYKDSGCLAALMRELGQAQEEPQFEMRIERNVSHETSQTVVNLMGYPDIYFISKEGKPIVYDWKVNGYCGKARTTPTQGYIKLVDGWKGEQSRAHNKSHKNAVMMYDQGIRYNCAQPLHTVQQSWANQTIAYGWMLGMPIGGDFIIGIDQITKYDGEPGNFPKLRIATHRSKADPKYQMQFFAQVCHVWESIKSGHIFDDVSRKKSDDRCLLLDNYYKAKNDDAFQDLLK